MMAHIADVITVLVFIPIALLLWGVLFVMFVDVCWEILKFDVIKWIRQKWGEK